MNQSINPSVSIESHEDRWLTVWLNSSNRSVNVVDAEMLDGLEAVVEHIASLPERYRAVIFRSRKPSGFFAGADVYQITELSNENIAKSVVMRGQQLMHSIEHLPLPTVAAIDGTCMGGGLEVALSCRYRVATDALATRLGLPEIKLGLLPGWGGTQRLPRLVGIRRGLQMILTGSPAPAAKALRWGLVDAVANKDNWETGLSEFVQSIVSGELKRRRRSLTLVDRLLDHTTLGRSLVLRAARRRIAAQSRNYPATTEAISSVAMAFHRGKDGYAHERDAFARLLFTATARSLLGLFVQRDRARKTATWFTESSDIQPKPFEQVAIVGGGAMGAGIAKLAALKGFPVVCKEVNAEAAESAETRVRQQLTSQVEQHRLSEEDQRAALKRMKFTANWEPLRDCDLAIEAVLEIEGVKQDVFRALDANLGEQAVLASNTSSLNVTRMASVTKRMERVGGLHFFNPVDRMELVEVVRTEATDDETLTRLLRFVGSLGKTPIVTSDKPGFLVNRVLFPYLGEAVRMIAEGYRAVEIDRELRRFGMPMGPLELIDQVGVDIASHVAQSLRSLLPDAEVPGDFLANMASRGWLGKKSKLGFYEYRKGRHQRVNQGLPVVPRTQPISEYLFLDDGLSAIQRRLVYAMLNEAVHCLDEQVVEEAWMVDLGMVLGTGFAPMYGGPLRLIDSLGVKTVQHNLNGLAVQQGERFRPADGLVRRGRYGGRFLEQPKSLAPAERHAEFKSNAISS